MATILVVMQSIPGDYQYHAIHSGRPAQRFWHSAKIRLIERLEIARSNVTALDAGCGSGVVSDYLAKHCQHVVGIDASTDAVNFATQQFGRENLHFQVCSLTHASTIGSFDLVVCFEVLEHLVRADIKTVLKEFHQATTTGGQLCVTVPNSRSFWPLIEWVLDTFRLVPKLKGEQHLSSFSKKLLSSLLEESGWTVRQIGTFNGLAPFLSRISQNFALFIERREVKFGKYAPLNLLYCVAERNELV
jgi:2-polyprenyl-3-methyl-5-hydroxy-6-metoxy-1,4-benzoquinol methylase